MLDNETIYLDYAATTPIDLAVREAMLPYLSDERFGNASSVHQTGQRVRRALDAARDQVAAAIGAEAAGIFFTSGGTESDNTALLGVLLAAREESGRDHLVITAVEHHAVLDCARFMESTLGFAVSVVPVDSQGCVDPDRVAAVMTDRTALVSVMHANNEIGTIQPIPAIAERVHALGALLHTDAVQSFGQLPLDFRTLGADLVTLSAHKIYGPKGAGALVVRDGVRWRPWLHGGQQEREKRAGTENAAAIVGFGVAAERVTGWRPLESVRLAALQERFLQRVRRVVPGAVLNGPSPGDRRLPNNVNLSFPGADAETLLLSLDLHGIAASSGSACASGSIEPSHVLQALGGPPDIAASAVRFSLGRDTTGNQLDRVADLLPELVNAAGQARPRS